MKENFIVVKNFLDLSFAHSLYEYLKFSTQVSILRGEDIYNSKNVPGCVCQKANDLMLDAVLKTSKEKIETITKLNLIPTYSMARIYTNGNELRKHIDRPSCEISVTIKLSDTKNYNYPIYMDGHEVFLEDGDAVVYKGTEVEHWRNRCECPEKYFLGQLFLHYVKLNGLHNDYAYDTIEDRKKIFEGFVWQKL
jgi:hypothetical protein